MPYTCPAGPTRRLSSAIARPGPKPTSRTRSAGCTSSNEATLSLRWRDGPSPRGHLSGRAPWVSELADDD